MSFFALPRGLVQARRRFAAVAVLLIVGADSGCGTDGGGDGGTGPEVTPEITLTLSPTSATIEQGSSDVVDLRVARSGGFTGTVSFSVTGAPTGVTGTVGDVSTSGTVTTATLTIEVGDADPGAYNVTVQALGSGVSTATAVLSLTVTERVIPIEISVDPTSATVEQGGSTTATAMITPVGGIVTPPPSFSVIGAPAGVTVTVGDPVDQGTSFTASITIEVGAGVDPGTYTLTVQGMTPVSPTVTTPFDLTVTEAPAYTLVLGSSALSIDQGDESDVQVSIDRTNFTGAVTLSLEGPEPSPPAGPRPGPLPAGVTATIEPNPVSGDAATLTLVVDGAVAAAQYSLTVRGVAEGLEDRTSPLELTVVEVAPPAPIRFEPTEIAVGSAHGCRLDAGGDAFCWGFDTWGQLGDDVANATKSVPVAVAGGHTFEWIVAGGSHTCGLDGTGKAFCWGSDDSGQLGDDAAQVNQPTPVPVGGNLTFEGIAAGGLSTCALTMAGEAYCWGSDFYSQLGNGPPNQNEPLPVPVSGGIVFGAISVGSTHACGLDLTGQAYCWGNDGYGELGDGSPIQGRNVPVPVGGGHTFVLIASGERHACALDPQGNAYCWGADFGGQLGDGAGSQSQCGANACALEPVAVVAPVAFQALTGGGDHTCGLDAAGNAYCWGMDDQGQLGDGAGSMSQCNGLGCAVVSAEQLGNGPGISDQQAPGKVMDLP